MKQWLQLAWQPALRFSALIVLLFATTGCQSLQPNEWTPIKETDGVEVSFRKIAHSNVPEFKGVTTMPGTIQRLLDVLMDVKSYPDWVYQCQSARIINTVGYDQIYLYQVNKPPVLKTRDIVLHGTIENDTASKTIRVRLNAEPDYCVERSLSACDVVNQSKHLRVTKSSGFFEAQQIAENQLRVTWQQHVEPGGVLPGWLVRGQLDNLAITTLNNLHRIMANPPSP